MLNVYRFMRLICADSTSHHLLLILMLLAFGLHCHIIYMLGDHITKGLGESFLLQRPKINKKIVNERLRNAEAG